uniref:Uncharacterized protein n=1 Tax=Mycena chlorophos TaxID=658473 RepID=A0ABQ0LHX3_MYCCL|nr:predicted protein [Mycena chlorophos]
MRSCRRRSQQVVPPSGFSPPRVPLTPKSSPESARTQHLAARACLHLITRVIDEPALLRTPGSATQHADSKTGRGRFWGVQSASSEK